MSWTDRLKELNEIDLNDLDFENVGAWPAAARAIVAIIVFAALVIAGYYYHVADLADRLAASESKELELRREFERKAFEALNVGAYKLQLQEMRDSFGALVSQLPSDTEVPGLLEDISAKGELNGLAIESIDLLDEVREEFYVELPISIEAEGSYHDLGAFISGMAGLPRIVTLHDFDIEMSGDDSSNLSMEITAKTYRYRDEGEDD
ncbi:pilus assembly protein PilP [Candidatus Paraluminiphilus aquimaris]|uniref:Pilus assembly protein PilP n=1 Tax=Candidatus Paraluminiphilus aquimaris TaxID=2518994 RepID=A0ABY6Q3Q3_9GAMM|nr:type 4a pilus biogenesis protein PilO [Candidatus Paraluminiphilus aquimaris]UZP73887.1 pilus assembly protein PilP [Candidatus Paraluminiphilus aquimaris]